MPLPLPRVQARTDLASALQAKGAAWLRERQLKLSDVQVLIESGTAARQADREQQEQLAEHAVQRKERSVNASEVSEREDVLAATLPAVIDDLERAGQREPALFLARLSFARYRTKVLSTPVDPGAPLPDEVKKVERVEKSDLATRADGLAALCAALRKPGREAIIAELTERGIDGAALEQLESDATAVASQGRNYHRPIEATTREQEAVLQ